MREFSDYHGGDDEEYEQPLFHFEDDEDTEPVVFHFDDSDAGSGRSAMSSQPEPPQFEFADEAPSAPAPAAEKPTAPQNASPAELDQPVMFGGDVYRSPEPEPVYSETDEPAFVPHFDDDDPIDDDNISFSFGKVDADQSEKEYIFMPFLDIPDEPEEEDGEKITLSFSKVKAERREKEFIFMPFLNVPEEEEEEDTSDQHGRFQTSKGTIVDEGLVLIPLEPEEEEEEEEAEEGSSSDKLEEDSGISIVGGDVEPRKPVKKSSGDGKKRSSGKGGSKSSKSGSKEKLDPEQQFRQAMRNIDPQILAAVRNDPVQRAALEQAVRIALVQQAAQEAVEKATGRPVFGYSAGAQKSTDQKKKKKKPRSAAERPSTPYESTSTSKYGKSGRTINVQSSGVGSIFDTAPSEFGVDSDSSAPPPPPVVTTPDINNQPASFDPAISSSSSKMSPAQMSVTPSALQDPVIAALENRAKNRGMPDASQDPALAALSGSSGGHDAAQPRTESTPASQAAPEREKRIVANSPAAIRAAMRNGVDVAAMQTAASNASANAGAAAAHREATAAADITKRSGCLVWIIVLFIAFFIGLLALAVWPALSNELKYQSATDDFSAGSYLSAAQAFDKLDDYKDSARKSDEAYYAYASQLSDNGEFIDAIANFKLVDPTYQDVSERLAACQYSIGKQFLDSGDYIAAYDQLYQIPKYLDAGELAKQANYNAAEKFYADGNYENARVRYSMFLDYLDSREKWQSAQFLCAQELENESKFKEAYELYAEIPDYNYGSYHAAITLAQAAAANGSKAFTYEEMRSAALELLNYPTDEAAQNAMNTRVFNMYLFEGTWKCDDGTVIFSISPEDGANTLAIDLAQEGGRVEHGNVAFIDDDIFTNSSGDGELLLSIVSFSSTPGEMPASVTIKGAFGETYTLTRA